MSDARGERRSDWLLWAVCACAVVVVYGPVVTLGLWQDDYMDLRPYDAARIWQVLTGPWGVAGFQDLYHRPLASLLNGGLYAVFGLNPPVLHALTLGVLVATVVALHRWVTLEAGPEAGRLAVVAYLLHPALGVSSVIAMSSFRHLVIAWLVITVLRCWHSARTRRQVRAWWPCLLLGTLGVWIKEDTGMILPALVALQWMRAVTVGDVPRPWPRLLWSVGACVGLVVVVRMLTVPSAEVVAVALRDLPWTTRVWEIAYGPARTLLVQAWMADVEWGRTLLAAACVSAALVAALRRDAGVAHWLARLALVLFGCLAVPHVLAPDATLNRAHLLTLSASLVWTAGLVYLWNGLRAHGGLRRAVVIVALALVVVQAAVVRGRITERFSACAPEIVDLDQWVLVWPDRAVPPDLKAYLSAKLQWCAAGQVGDAPILPRRPVWSDR